MASRQDWPPVPADPVPGPAAPKAPHKDGGVVDDGEGEGVGVNDKVGVPVEVGLVVTL